MYSECDLTHSDVSIISVLLITTQKSTRRHCYSHCIAYPVAAPIWRQTYRTFFNEYQTSIVVLHDVFLEADAVDKQQLAQQRDERAQDEGEEEVHVHDVSRTVQTPGKPH